MIPKIQNFIKVSAIKDRILKTVFYITYPIFLVGAILLAHSMVVGATPLDCTDGGSDGIVDGIIIVTNDGTSNCNTDGINDEVEIGMAVTNGAGKTVYIKGSPKSYKISGAVTVNEDDITIRGDGNSTVIYLTGGSADNGGAFRTNEDGHHNITYSYMRMEGSHNYDFVFGWLTEFIGFDGVNNFTVENIYDNSGGTFVGLGGFLPVSQYNSGHGVTNAIVRNNIKTKGRFLKLAWINYVEIYNNTMDSRSVTIGNGMDFNRDYGNLNIHDNIFRGKYSSNLVRFHSAKLGNYEFRNNTFENTYDGGAGVSVFYIDHAKINVRFINNTFTGNSACMDFTSAGTSYDFEATNNIFYNCKYGVRTNGDHSGDTFNFKNNVFHGSTIDAISIESSFDINFENNIIINSTGSNVVVSSGTLNDFNYNDVWNAGMSNYIGTVSGIGNLNVNPLFADPANHDFHLKSKAGRWTPKGWVTDLITSPAIDAGDPSSDYSKEPNPDGGRINLGAYGNTGEASKSALSGAPIANPSVNRTSGDAPLTVGFIGDGKDFDGTIVSYHWNFGDGSTSSSRNVTHTFTSVGYYDVILTVTDNSGNKGNGSVKITVSQSDTTPPAIGNVFISDANKVIVFFLEPVEGSSATTVSNYAIDNGITISSASLGTDLRTVTLTTSTHVGGNNYTLTVNNVQDIAKIPNTILPNTKINYQYNKELIISNINTISGKNYAQDTLATGKLQYIDRTYTFSSLPIEFAGLNFIKTANDDKASADTDFLEFDINRDVKVYVAHDDRIATKPTWLVPFIDTGDNLVSGGGTFSLYAMNFSAGHIILGGNGNSVGSFSMYTVVLRPFDSIVYSRSDVNLDGLVNIDDLINIVLNFNKQTAPPYPRIDINEDGIVDIFDIRIVSSDI